MSVPGGATAEGGDFDAELQDLLSRYNKSLGDLKEESSEAGAMGPAGMPDKVRRQVVEHIHTVKGAGEGHHYRRLRTFSGRVPVPPGELPFDVWHQHADQMVEEAPLTEEDKRSRLAECLMPPALTFYRKAVKELGPGTTASELLDQLTQAFGVACDGDDLFTLFRETYQENGEKPSAYLTRLEGRLDQALQFGDIDPADADRHRLNQFIRGCIFDNGLVGALQLRQRKLKPPGLLELLQEVRVEEGAEAARSVRRQQSKPTKRVQACRVTAPDESNRKIEEELTNLKAQLAAIQAPPPPMDTPVVTTPETAHLVAELERLRKELSQLKNNSLGRSPKPPFKGKIICYRCGEPGHMVRECQRPPNAELVQRRLLERSQRPSGNEVGRHHRDNEAPRR